MFQQYLEKIRTAAKPPKFTIQFMKDLGFTSSNDQAYPSLLKKLGFVTDDGIPTSYYDQLRDQATAKIVLADRMKSLYSELFAINIAIQTAPETEVKGAISRVTGREAKDVNRIFSTFKALCDNADFSQSLADARQRDDVSDAIPPVPTPEDLSNGAQESFVPNISGFHYNIQIHLPATTDISVYNAIFKSIRENFK